MNEQSVRAMMGNLLRVFQGAGLPAQDDKLGTQRQRADCAPWESTSDLRVSVMMALAAQIRAHDAEALVCFTFLSLRDFARGGEDWAQAVGNLFGIHRATVHRYTNDTVERMALYLGGRSPRWAEARANAVRAARRKKLSAPTVAGARRGAEKPVSGV